MIGEGRLTVNKKSPRSPHFVGIAEDMMLVDVEDVELGKVAEVGLMITGMKLDIEAAVEAGVDWDVEVSLDTRVKIEIEVDFKNEELKDVALNPEIEVELDIGFEFVVEVCVGNELFLDNEIELEIDVEVVRLAKIELEV